MRVRSPLLFALTALLTSCSNGTEPVVSAGSLLVANASNGFVDVDIDGQRRATGLSMNAMSWVLAVPAGLHVVRVSHGGGIGGAIEVPVDVGAENSQTVVAFPAYPVGTTPDMSAAVLVDTGAFVAGGKSKLRVAHLSATAGDIRIWRRQPDSSPGSVIATPVRNGEASPYLESTAGVWEVWLAALDGTKRLTTGPIQIGSGERRTVLLVDTQEGPRFVVMGL